MVANIITNVMHIMKIIGYPLMPAIILIIKYITELARPQAYSVKNMQSAVFTVNSGGGLKTDNDT